VFCPGVWLKNHRNRIVILDLLQTDAAQVSGKKTLK